VKLAEEGVHFKVNRTPNKLKVTPYLQLCITVASHHAPTQRAILKGIGMIRRDGTLGEH
jgi:hypothetical protein